MNKFDGFLLTMISVIVVFLLFFIPYGLMQAVDNRNIKDLMYQECITTKYDKFQCYAMIYGDK